MFTKLKKHLTALCNQVAGFFANELILAVTIFVVLAAAVIGWVASHNDYHILDEYVSEYRPREVDERWLSCGEPGMVLFASAAGPSLHFTYKNIQKNWLVGLTGFCFKIDTMQFAIEALQYGGVVTSDYI